jgi:CheY-like chemotaxis protein
VTNSREDARLIGERLRRIGVEVRLADHGAALLGWLPLSPVPFRTLGPAFTVARVRFYALDAKRIKFSSPRMFFDVPAIDVSQCNSGAQIEQALRRAWEKRLGGLRDAEGWLDRLGADVESQVHGTRLALHLTGESGPPALVRSATEILLPSCGPLKNKVVTGHRDRIHRPWPGLDLSSELEMGAMAQMSRVAVPPRRLDSTSPLLNVAASAPKPVETAPRILLLHDGANDLGTVESALRVRGFDFKVFRDLARALEAFHEETFDLVISGVRMPRVDGLEFTSRVHGLAGVERLPVVLIDETENRANARAAIVAGASAYLWKPFAWEDTGDTLLELIERPARRRFTRYRIQLALRVEHSAGVSTERTDAVARGGLSVRTSRDPPVGSLERYRIRMPPPLEPVEAEGVVVTRVTIPGKASVISAIRLLRFGPGSEARWIKLIEALERRKSPGDRRRD